MANDAALFAFLGLRYVPMSLALLFWAHHIQAAITDLPPSRFAFPGDAWLRRRVYARPWYRHILRLVGLAGLAGWGLGLWFWLRSG